MSQPAPSKSSKSDSGSRQHPRIRDLTIQDVDEEDGRIAYFNYRLGTLPKGWKTREGIAPVDFLVELEQFVSDNYDRAWSIRHEDVICMVFGRDIGGFLIVGDVIWNPKSTPRQKVEAAYKFFSEIDAVITGVDFETKKYYERIMDYGILRRVGTNYKDGQRYAQYESKR